MATGYWRGADNATWNTTTNWWTTIGGTTTVATVPGAGEIAFFNANGTTTARNVYLNGSRSLGTFWMNGNAQGDITLRGGVSGGETTQTLTLGGIDMSGTSANAIFSSSVNVALANAQSWSIGSGRAILVSGVISGAFKLTSNNSGVIILGNANTYSGGTDISAGTVRAGNNQALGTGAGSIITMTGGTLSSDSTSARTLANALSLNGTMTLGNATNTGALTFSGTTTIAGTTALTTASVVTFSGQLTGSETLTKSGSGALFLTGTTNNNSGAFTNSAGDIYLASGVSGTPNQLNAAASLTLNGGSLNFLGGTALSQLATQPVSGSGTLRVYDQGGVTINGNTNTPGFSGSIETFSDDPTGNTTPSLTFASATAFPLSANQITAKSNNSSGTVTHTVTYSGAADISTTTQYWGHFAYQTAFTRVINHSATGSRTWSIGGSTWISNDNAKDVALQFNVASGNTLNITVPFKQFSTGLFSLEKLGAGTMTLSGDNQISKTITVSVGRLNANSATALGTDTSSGTVSSGATLSLGAALNYSTRTFTINGTGVGSGGALVHAFAGTANIGTITLGAASYIRGTASGTSTLSSPIALGSFTVTAGAASGNTLSLSGGITGGVGGLIVGRTVSDTGTVTLTTANSYAGGADLFYGTLSISNASALGSGELVFSGGTFDVSTPLTVTNTTRLQANLRFGGTAALTLTSGIVLFTNYSAITNGTGSALTLSGVISTNGGAAYKFTKEGTNTLILTNALNSYSGGTDILGGTLAAGNITALNTTGTVTIGASGTLQTLTGTGGSAQKGKLFIAALTNSAGGTIKIGG